MNINNCNHTDTEKHQEEKIFLYTTITGNLQLIHLEQIGYFRYNSKSKLWEAVLNNIIPWHSKEIQTHKRY